MKVLVCGTQRFTDREFIHHKLMLLDCERGPFTQIAQFGSGHGSGPDAQVRDWVFEKAVGETEFKVPPLLTPVTKLRTYHHDWDQFGPGAHHRTYERIMRDEPPDLVIVFGPERGQHRPFVRLAKAAGIPVVEYPFGHQIQADAAIVPDATRSAART